MGDPERVSPARAAHLARRWLPLALLLAVAAHQMWRVEKDGLTRWRGGGFGMYSSVHFEESEVWAAFDGPRGLRFVEIIAPAEPEARTLLPRCKLFPTEESLAELAHVLGESVKLLQLWRPRLDPDTLAYDRELVAEYRAEPGR